MGKQITIEVEEYERLKRAADALEAIEDAADLEAIEQARAHPEDGMPGRYVGRLIDREAPLRVFRDWRGLTQQQLADAAGVSRVQIAEIEAGRKTGSVATLGRLAEALSTTIDELVPWPPE
ncbi:MAG: helix-turn-helix transcriptional regulator [Pseudomonadota bacterium]